MSAVDMQSAEYSANPADRSTPDHSVEEMSQQLETLLGHLKDLGGDGGVFAGDIFKVARAEFAITRMSIVAVVVLGLIGALVGVSLLISVTALLSYLLAVSAGLGWGIGLAGGLLLNGMALAAIGAAAIVCKRQMGWTRTRTLVREIYASSRPAPRDEEGSS